MQNRNTKNWSYKVVTVLSVAIETDISKVLQKDVQMIWTAADIERRHMDMSLLVQCQAIILSGPPLLIY